MSLAEKLKSWTYIINGETWTSFDGDGDEAKMIFHQWLNKKNIHILSESESHIEYRDKRFFWPGWFKDVRAIKRANVDFHVEDGQISILFELDISSTVLIALIQMIIFVVLIMAVNIDVPKHFLIPLIVFPVFFIIQQRIRTKKGFKKLLNSIY